MTSGLEGGACEAGAFIHVSSAAQILFHVIASELKSTSPAAYAILGSHVAIKDEVAQDSHCSVPPLASVVQLLAEIEITQSPEICNMIVTKARLVRITLDQRNTHTAFCVPHKLAKWL